MSSPHTHGPYAKAARLRKAIKLADHLHSYGITADEIGNIEPEEWRKLARIVEVNAPSDETISMVRERLKEMEANDGTH